MDHDEKKLKKHFEKHLPYDEMKARKRAGNLRKNFKHAERSSLRRYKKMSLILRSAFLFHAKYTPRSKNSKIRQPRGRNFSNNSKRTFIHCTRNLEKVQMKPNLRPLN